MKASKDKALAQEPQVDQKKARTWIPLDAARQILIESGHRCAVCGEPCPLQRAHIIPWRISKSNEPEDLICLCANCHQRADQEDWGSKTLRDYKKLPWVLRRFSEREEPSAAKRVEVVLDMEFDSFAALDERLLVFALAAFLDISPTRIRVSSVEEGSVKITLELSRRAANRLVEAASEDSDELYAFLEPFRVKRIGWRDRVGFVAVDAKRVDRDIVLIFYPLSRSLVVQDIMDFLSSFGPVEPYIEGAADRQNEQVARFVVPFEVAVAIGSALASMRLAGREPWIFESAIDLLGLPIHQRVLYSFEDYLVLQEGGEIKGKRSFRLEGEKSDRKGGKVR